MKRSTWILAALLLAAAPLAAQSVMPPIITRTDSSGVASGKIAWPATYDSSRVVGTICGQVRVAGATKSRVCRTVTGPWVRHVVVPPPPLPAPPPLFASMLLHAEGSLLKRPDNALLDFRGAIGVERGYDFPLFNERWVDLVKPYGVNFLHLRLGPFLTSSGGESGLAWLGGGYVEAGGKADLTQFNSAFWARVAAIIAYAGSNGMWVEVDVADGWGIKQGRPSGQFPGYSAWKAGNNVQGEDWSGAGSVAVAPSSRQDAWIRKVIQVTGAYGNVVYQDGNEIGMVGETGGNPYAPAWTISMRDIIRNEESLQGYQTHLFGTNSEHTTTEQHASIQYIEHHNDGGAIAPLYNKPTLVNEYNPTPAITPSQVAAQVCVARAVGSQFWYWLQEDQTAAIEQTLALIAQGCATPEATPGLPSAPTLRVSGETGQAADIAVTWAAASGASSYAWRSGADGALTPGVTDQWAAQEGVTTAPSVTLTGVPKGPSRAWLWLCVRSRNSGGESGEHCNGIVLPAATPLGGDLTPPAPPAASPTAQQLNDSTVVLSVAAVVGGDRYRWSGGAGELPGIPAWSCVTTGPTVTIVLRGTQWVCKP